MTQSLHSSDYSFLIAPGQLGELIRRHDWSATPLGPIEQWPQSLKTSVSLMLNSQHPMWIGWGPDATFLYNDAYIHVLSLAKHPWALGLPAAEVWQEIWDICGPLADKVFGKGEPTFVDDVRLFMSRGSYLEETYYSFSYSPIREESGGVGGLFCPSAETTSKVLSARRLQTLSDLAAKSLVERSVTEACSTASEILSRNPDDIPFALLYLVNADARRAVLEQAVGLPLDNPECCPAVIELGANENTSAWPIDGILASQVNSQAINVAHLKSLPIGLADQAIKEAIAMPVKAPGQEHAAGILIAGVSPARQLDEEYRAFFELVAAQVATAIQNAKTISEERQRADMLAEIDRAKTTFFSNISHEFRTPLTLMLGPIADALNDQQAVLPSTQRERINLAQRNALRLQKLVNSLLDFSRLQAGRVQARYVKTDLAHYTADLASTFRAAIEKAGLKFAVDCQPLPEPAYVDPSMWEKIVFNLLSNAFKFTFEGEIGIRLRMTPDRRIELAVLDSGVGIAPENLPRVFERFQRIEGTKSRTHEGSGIGLSLVQDLAGLHGGGAAVQSTLGQGTIFTVTIPAGHEHLPAEHVEHSAYHHESASQLEQAYLLEMETWMPPNAETAALPVKAQDRNIRKTGADSARVLVADDNTDMRNYIARLLEERWTVVTAENGQEALEAINANPPDLVVSDVMMPVLDGFGLLNALKTNDATRNIPFIMLSARAGEEAKIEGLDAGADDYLVKPFSGRELMARIESLLLRARLRRVQSDYAKRMRSIFEQAPAAIAILAGPNHVYELANKPYLEFIDGRAVLGKPIREALPELAGQGIYELLDEVYHSGISYVGREVRADLMRGTPPAMKECYFDFVYHPMFDADNQIDGIAVVGFEVTALVKARQDAEVASRAKDEFLAMLGHELRNPLAPILTAAQLMRLRGFPQVENERAIIERQAKHLVRLVDDLLDVSRVTRGKIELRKERIEAAVAVAKAIEMASPLLEERAQYFNLYVPDSGLLVDADPARLSQVIGNLLTNAAKYTDKGGRISLTADREDDFIRIAVTDSGIGIAPDMQPKIFDVFVQGSQSLDRSHGGLGLGLAIVRSLTELHGGTVSVHSAGLGMGSTFTVRIPAAEPLMNPNRSTFGELNANESAAAPTGFSILIVDDNVDAARALADILELYGHRVAIAEDGPSGLNKAMSHSFDFALLDIGLPGMDGYELARRLHEGLQHDCPRLIAITGYGLETDRNKAVDAGFDMHLVKPVDVERLNETLRVVAKGSHYHGQEQ